MEAFRNLRKPAENPNQNLRRIYHEPGNSSEKSRIYKLQIELKKYTSREFKKSANGFSINCWPQAGKWASWKLNCSKSRRLRVRVLKTNTNIEEPKATQFRQRHDIPDKKKQKPSPLIGTILDKYREASYPDSRQKERDKDSSYFHDQEDYYTMLKSFFGQKYVNELRQSLLNEYHLWRKKPDRMRAGTVGDRITDLELTCLSNALGWAFGQDVIQENPIKSRTRYQSSKDVRHCKELAPEDMDQLHQACGLMFSNRKGESLGWQALFEALSGVRTCEALAMRLDANRATLEPFLPTVAFFVSVVPKSQNMKFLRFNCMRGCSIGVPPILNGTRSGIRTVRGISRACAMAEPLTFRIAP